MAKLDVAEARKKVVSLLHSLGYTERDADMTDFARPDTRLRFKVGTAYTEISATVWLDSAQVSVIRVTDTAAMDKFLGSIEEWTRRNIV